MNLFLAISPLLLASAAADQPDCEFDAAALLALPYEQFDQDVTGGWRTLQYEGCLSEAVEILRLYRTTKEALRDGQRRLLSWHEGQVLAFMGDYESAVPALLAGIPSKDSEGFGHYANGTVAFLRRDKPGLLAARARLAALPKPADWVDIFPAVVGGKTVLFSSRWPQNLHVLDNLIECFDRPYAEAYQCRS